VAGAYTDEFVDPNIKMTADDARQRRSKK